MTCLRNPSGHQHRSSTSGSTEIQSAQGRLPLQLRSPVSRMAAAEAAPNEGSCSLGPSPWWVLSGECSCVPAAGEHGGGEFDVGVAVEQPLRPCPFQDVLQKLADGVTMDQVTTYLATPSPPEGSPPISFVGGVNALSPGQSAWIDLGFAPGRYVWWCVIPDLTKGGIPHLKEGMLTPFEVG